MANTTSTIIGQESEIPEELPGFHLIDIGLSDYDAVYSLQLDLVSKKRKAKTPHDYLILVEHPDVYTFGRKSKVKAPMDFSNVFFVERGGEVTYHNPGQLVCYPVLFLKESERDLHLHLRRLEWTIIDVLLDFGIEAERRDGATGVWLIGQEKKIASIGVAVSGWVTYHGCALNISNDLGGFQRINPCGFSSKVMTSMKEELGDEAPSIGEVKASFIEHFAENFRRSLIQ